MKRIGRYSIVKTQFSADQQIKYGSMISYLLIALNVILGLLYTPWILHEIGSSHYGLYTLATSLISLFLMDFGMSAAVTRFVALYRAQNNQKKIAEFLSVTIKLYLIIMTMISVVLIVVYFNINRIYSNLTMDELETFRVVFILTGVCVVICLPVNICNGVLNAYEEYIELKLSEFFNRVGTVIVTIIALSHHGGLFALILINEGFNLLTFLIKLWLIRCNIPIKLELSYFNLREMKEAFSFSLWTTVISISQSMIFNIMPTILAMTLDTMAITLYGFANVIEGYVSTITGAINGMFLPKISRITVGEKDASQVLPLMIKVGRINQSIVTLLLIGLIVLGREFVTLWVGEEYALLFPCILLLSLPYFISASQQIANSSITALNKVKYSAIINIVTGVLNLLVAYFVSGKFGIVGVCVTIGCTFMLRLIAINIVYVKILKINIGRFFLECQGKLMPATLLCLGIAFVIDGSVHLWSGSWIGFFIKVVLIMLEYFLCMWMIGWNRFEKDLLKSFILR